MGPSEGFIDKSLEVQINEILKEDILFTQENIVHYYVDIGGNDEPFSNQGSGSKNTPEPHFSDFLRLLNKRSHLLKLEASHYLIALCYIY